ncbi:hypothetical protein Y032_0414g1047 [Ancylostoma ceylanicum]|uniref:Peptidase A2 domain-containing protein n=1 Tax=Ancylostoma ceylanicum TaxID=53326 RepID=A0A016X3R9_9BILA|nr:hypothetical protein Y032_0414g1047 [Ancylostoma ceylanicum]
MLEIAHCAPVPPNEDRSPRQVSSASSYLTLVESWSCSSAVDAREPSCPLFGYRCTTLVNIMGLTATALLDTGSEISIVSVQFLRDAAKMGVNLDEYIERVEPPSVRIRDASGNAMQFFDTIRIAITVYGKPKVIPCFVARGLDSVIILGTNALEALGIGLMAKVRHETPREVEEAEEKKLHGTTLVKDQIAVTPTKTSFVTLTRVGAVQEPRLWSMHPETSHRECTKAGGCRSESWTSPNHVGTSRDITLRPLQIEDTPVQTKAKGKSRKKSVKIARVNRICFRSRPESDGDISAMSTKHNNVRMIPLVESATESSQSMGLHPRSSATETYPRPNRNLRHGCHRSNDDISDRTQDGGVTKTYHARKSFRRNPFTCVVPDVSNNTNPNLMLSYVMPHCMHPQA